MLSLALLTLLPVSAQDTQQQEPQREIERITVIGQRSLFSIRREVLRAEDRVCEPICFTKLVARNTQGAWMEMRQAFDDNAFDIEKFERGSSYLETGAGMRVLARAEFEELNNEIFKLATENPEYFNALKTFADLKSKYESEKKKYFEK